MSYRFQIQRMNNNGRNMSFTDVGKPSRTYGTVKEVRAAARDYLIKHDLVYLSRVKEKNCIAAIFRDGEEVDSLGFDGYQVISYSFDKVVTPSGNMRNITYHDGGRW